MKGTVRFIRVWGSGQLESDILEPGEDVPDKHSTAVVLEHAGHLDAARDAGLVGPPTRVFVPGAPDSVDGSEGAIVLGYDGSLSDPGGDVQIGSQFFLQTQDYGTSEYLSLVGPTLVRVVDDRDLGFFLADADTALATGELPDFLTHPLVRLGDVPALGGEMGHDGPRLRLYISADGGISTSVNGSLLGSIGDDLAALQARHDGANAASEHPCAVGLGRAVSEDVRVAGLRERPWLARYHQALAAVRALRVRGEADGPEVRVSGFGGRLVPELAGTVPARDLSRTDVPLLLWTGSGAYVHDPRGERTFKVSTAVAGHAEHLLVHGDVESAGRSADREQLVRLRDHFDRIGMSLCA